MVTIFCSQISGLCCFKRFTISDWTNIIKPG